jgi:phage gp37-like protein
MMPVTTQVELAIIERLKLGLGRMAIQVESYGGQLDDDLDNVVRAFPSVWVTFGGITRTVTHGVSRKHYATHARFVVMVGDYNVRNEGSTRMGGPALDEVGSYRLVHAVRRLLINQDFGLKIDELKPGRVRTLFNTKTSGKAVSVFGCEFDTYWIEDVLARGRWPEPQSSDDPDYLFVQYQGKTDTPYADLKSINLRYHLTDAPGDEAAADDTITLREADNGSDNS